MILIYISFYNYLQADLFKRLKGRMYIAISLYIESDKQSADGLVQIKKSFQEKIPGEVIRIYNEFNQPIFIVEGMQNWSSTLLDQIRENGAVEYADNEWFIVGELVKYNEGDYVIIASAQYPDRIKKLTQFIIFMVLIFVASLILIFAVGRWFSQKTLSPINKLIGQLQEINASNLNKRVTAKHKSDEIGLLAENFNKLLIQLESAFELQKAFVANASHELRTPITTIIGEAEVSLKQARTIEEYQAIIQSILVESEKLDDTISGLIDLAQVDLNFSRAVLMPIRIDDLLWELQEYWSKKLYPNALLVTMENLSENESSLIIKANKALLVIALNNIIGNAFKFSDNSPVKCILQVEVGKIKIKVIDKGIGINNEFKERIFEAFFRSERSTGYTGTGIGLYITHKIVQMLDGSIEVLSLPKSGTVMTLEFNNINFNDSQDV
ncbi:MAG TPA: two-component sensor histidine kinase [Sphingobacteriaceae bacterium]|nr:two-component sensor histidine kinase [Sphingobacteriaceae bacterium]